MRLKWYSEDPGDTKDVTVVMLVLSESRWREIKSKVSDPDQWCETYDQWLATESANRKTYMVKGYTIVDFSLSLDQAKIWCQSKKLVLSTKSISKYVISSYTQSCHGQRGA
ncbi:MAG: hypothetical protein AMXMBFR7_43610 [Planctomycetota bacterium]